jgi:hypothetical protein
MQYELVHLIHWNVKYLIGNTCENISQGYSNTVDVVARDAQAAHDIGEAVVQDIVDGKRKCHNDQNADNKDAPPFDDRVIIESVTARGTMYAAGKMI